MTVTQYIGARYQPIFADPAEWNSTRTYEPLTIVLNKGNSYTSRQYVPAGIELENTDYWLVTGNYNAQTEQYRAEVKEAVDNVAKELDQQTKDVATQLKNQDNKIATQIETQNTTINNLIKQQSSDIDAKIAKQNENVTKQLETQNTNVTKQLETQNANVASKLSEVDTKLATKAPLNHASSATTYGVGSDSNYGHVKLTSTYSSSDTSKAVTGKAVASAIAGSSALAPTVSTVSLSGSNSYSSSGGSGTGTATVYKYETLKMAIVHFDFKATGVTGNNFTFGAIGNIGATLANESTCYCPVNSNAYNNSAYGFIVEKGILGFKGYVSDGYKEQDNGVSVEGQFICSLS